MRGFFKLLLGIILVWMIVFCISFYTADDNVEMNNRIKYSGILAAVSVIGYSCFGAQTKKSKCQKVKPSSKNDRVLYIFEGEFGRKLVYRIQNNKIYVGMGNKYSYEIKDDKIYHALSSKWEFRIKGNRIYKGLDTRATYRLEGNKVYRGEFGHIPLYRITISKTG